MKVEYELVPQNDDERKAAASRRKSSSQANSTQGLRTSFLCLVACVLLILFVLGMYMDTMSPILDKVASKFGYDRSQYAVIIDAGSTGSRVLAYKFGRSYIDNKFYLDREIFEEIKPGLSSFADTPQKGAEKIGFLLDLAKRFVPKDKWEHTPLVLKATAGLRLLPPQKSEGILHAVRKLFEMSEFAVDANAVEIMDGTDEGIFSWFTVNLLLDRFSKNKQAAALDLGGGSTQVTFAPNDRSRSRIFENYMKPVHMLDREVKVFTHSYLGLGLMAVRHAVFTSNQTKKQLVLESDCVNPIIQNKTWIYGNVEYQISGKDSAISTDKNPIVDFRKCWDSIKAIVEPLVNPKPVTLNQHTVTAFSYYFERAIESGLVDVNGGEMKVQRYLNGAELACKTANTDQPFMCFDLTFISVLLKDGYGLSDDKMIKLYKKINNHEISWALGCAYNILTTNEKYKS